MPAMLGVADARARARAKRLQAVTQLLFPEDRFDLRAQYCADALLDMSDDDWRELAAMRRIEAKIRRDAARAIARTPQIIAARRARKVTQSIRRDA